MFCKFSKIKYLCLQIIYFRWPTHHSPTVINRKTFKFMKRMYLGHQMYLLGFLFLHEMIILKERGENEWWIFFLNCNHKDERGGNCDVNVIWTFKMYNGSWSSSLTRLWLAVTCVYFMALYITMWCYYNMEHDIWQALNGSLKKEGKKTRGIKIFMKNKIKQNKLKVKWLKTE